MCGILAVLNAKNVDNGEVRAHIVELSARQRHRGPDWSGVAILKNHIFAHERLAIVGLLEGKGEQPLLTEDGSIMLTVNGEIYNHLELRANLKGVHNFQTASDCEVLLYLYKEEGAEFLNKLQGDYAFVVTDGDSFLAARDPVGVNPLYWGTHEDGSMWFSSEMKTLVDDCSEIKLFPPGHYYTPEAGFVRWYNPEWINEDWYPSAPSDLALIRSTFITSVERRLMADVPFGVLLSGGLDSSLVASVAQRIIKATTGQPVASFSIGLKGQSPDLVAAKKVAQFLGTKHYEFTFEVQDGIDALKELIWHLESYDVTTIRASTPMFLLSRRIKALGYKMVLSGEGADEELAGYLYFGHAATPQDLHRETVNRVKNLHTSDCLRANKSTAAWGVEVRVPFLDKDFLDLVMSFDPAEKQFGGDRIEKYVMRQAFVDVDQPYLPDEVLWRQKEQFSDGVGYSWIDTLLETANQSVTDEMWESRGERWSDDVPATKEAYYFRDIFDSLFTHPDAIKTVVNWVPTWGASKDPSGRAQRFHVAHLQK